MDLSSCKFGLTIKEVVSGNICSESVKRLDFTVIGDVVNTAQRLESIGNPVEILINKVFYTQILEHLDWI